MRGAGGTSGGIVEFFLGVIMFTVGMFIFLSNVTVTNSFGMGTSIFRIGGSGGAGGFNFVSGMIFIPFLFGIALVFYNRKNIIGWVLTVGSIALLIIGIIISLQFRFRPMNLFNVIMIIVLIFGGVGLFLSSLRGKGENPFD